MSSQPYDPRAWKPPYAGAAPPVPQGWNIDPRRWQNGQWQFNGAAASQYSAGNAPWMPAQAWAQAQAAAASHNPYKRVPKPPSAEYMASKLSDNPLGLTNMVPREELYGKKEETGSDPHTPWIWNPRGLVEDDDEDEQGIIAADFRDHNGRRIGRELRGPEPTRHTPSNEHVSSASAQANRPRRSSSQTRQSSEPVPPLSQQQHQRNTSIPTRHSSEPPPDRQDRQRFQYAPRAEATPPPPQVQQDFTSSQPLRTTFSTSIIRTPDYYSRGSSARSTPSRSSTTDSQLSSQMDRLSTGDPSPNRPTRHHSASTLDGGSTFVEEPTSILSPLIMNTPKPLSNSRPISRHHSVPNGSSLAAIPETTSRGLAPQQLYPHAHQLSPSTTRSSTQPITPPTTSTSASTNRPYPSPTRSASQQQPQQQQYLVPSTTSTSTASASATRPYPSPTRASSQQQQQQYTTPPSTSTTSGSRAFPSSTQPSSQQQSQPQQQYVSASSTSGGTSPNRPYPSPTRPSPQHQPQTQHITPPPGSSTTRIHVTPPSTTTTTISSASAAANASASARRSSTLSTNPLPASPADVLSVPPPTQRTPPSRYTSRRRRGFWNRRGDHLTMTGKIVYAPPDKAFPDELREYPRDGEGYKDEAGQFMPFDERREELSESLPRWGKSPVQPYESFVVYEYR